MASAEGVRLIRVVDAFPVEGTTMENLRNEVLKAAAPDAPRTPKGRQNPSPRLALYVPVPPTMTAWGKGARSKIPLRSTMEQPLAETHESSAVSKNPIRLTLGQRLAQIHESSLGNPNVADFCSVPQLDVRFLRLAKEHISGLLANASTYASRFPSGLRSASSMMLTEQEDTFVDARAAELCLRPFDAEVATSTSSILFGRDNLAGGEPEIEIEIRLGDVYMDEAVANRILRERHLPLPATDLLSLRSYGAEGGALRPSISYDPDPYCLKNLAAGVFALYEVAEDCYGRLLGGCKKPTRVQVEAELNKKISKLFNQSDRAVVSVKFIDPDLNRKRRSANGQGFGPMAQHLIRSKYSSRSNFVSESLALIIHAVGHWLGLRARGLDETDGLLDELLTYGFNGDDELRALHAIITWNGKKVMPAAQFAAKLARAKDRHDK